MNLYLDILEINLEHGKELDKVRTPQFTDDEQELEVPLLLSMPCH
jgi:hypothetical protein